MSASTPLLSLKGITKIFPGVRALENVQLDLWPGKVTALIGENGAGKSTLVKVMTGIYQPEEGEILYKAIPIHLPTPESAHKVGITAIHQETAAALYDLQTFRQRKGVADTFIHTAIVMFCQGCIKLYFP